MTETAVKISAHLNRHRLVYILAGLVILLHITVLIDLIADWYRDDNYSHGFFIIPIAGYLFYLRRHKLSFPAKPYSPGIWLFLFGVVGLIFGTAASEYFTTRFGLVFMLTGIAMYYLGKENFRKIWFPFFFLWFMVPVPAVMYYAATLPMQLLATKVAVFLLDVLGVPVSRNGNIIILPGNYMLEVAEACSGLRSLVTLMALGALYAYWKMEGTVLSITLFILTIPIAVVTNIFRVFVTALGAYAISTELAESFLHEISGMLVFFTALILMIITGSILLWLRKRFTA